MLLYRLIGLAISISLCYWAFESWWENKPYFLEFETSLIEYEQVLPPVHVLEEEEEKIVPAIPSPQPPTPPDLALEFAPQPPVSCSQSVDEEVVEEEEGVDCQQVYTIVEQAAQPIGGMRQFYKYIKKNLKYPKSSKRMGIYPTKIFIRFIVECNGTLSNIEAVRSTHSEIEDVVVQLFEQATPWQPAKHQGKTVRQQICFPISCIRIK